MKTLFAASLVVALFALPWATGVAGEMPTRVDDSEVLGLYGGACRTKKPATCGEENTEGTDCVATTCWTATFPAVENCYRKAATTWCSSDGGNICGRVFALISCKGVTPVEPVDDF